MSRPAALAKLLGHLSYKLKFVVLGVSKKNSASLSLPVPAAVVGIEPSTREY